MQVCSFTLWRFTFCTYCYMWKKNGKKWIRRGMIGERETTALESYYNCLGEAWNKTVGKERRGMVPGRFKHRLSRVRWGERSSQDEVQVLDWMASRCCTCTGVRDIGRRCGWSGGTGEWPVLFGTFFLSLPPLDSMVQHSNYPLASFSLLYTHLMKC